MLPRSVDDVVQTLRTCSEFGVPLTARGAGTGLTGAAVNRGLIADCSRYLHRVLAIDLPNRRARVEPGVVLDELNAQLAPHGLQFAPDVATSSRATLGGMIAGNSCGAHSILYGRTVDHVLSLDVVLADGSRCTWGKPASTSDNPLAERCERTLAEIQRELAGEIAARYPKLLRSNGGYGLDRLALRDGRPNTEAVICGSEGTLAVVVGATLNLVPLPRHKGLLIVSFDDLMAALHAVGPALEHQPAAIELIDNLILRATESNPLMAQRRWFIEGQPQGVLAIEMFGEDERDIEHRLNALAADLQSRSLGIAHRVTLDPGQQADVWAVRKAGLGLLMSRPGPRQPFAFIEDTAVDPRRLPEFIERLDAILRDEGVEQTGHYAHASVGCLHVRPVLDLRHPADVQRMHRIADRVSSLSCEFGGTMSGEHGDGIVRSVWLEKMYGPRIIDAFRRIKQAFDPHGLLNPGKIVDPLPMTENLRVGDGSPPAEVLTTLDFSAHGGLAGLAEMCTGVGACRQRLSGTMCPSYMATGDETHTPRARANAVRSALSRHGLLDGLADPALDEVMDLCLACKACKTECPTGTDVTRLKAEWLARRNARLGVPRRTHFIAASIDAARWGVHFAPLSNWIVQSKVTRIILEHLFGLDRRVPPPPFARCTFRDWFRRHKPPTDLARSAARTPVVYFVDTWTNFYLPQVGQAAVRVLEALGCEVLVLPTRCCGRPLLSKGLLQAARELAEANVRVLGPYAERGVAIICTEPSCASALLDELPQLVRTAAARSIATQTVTIEAFVADRLRAAPDALPSARPLLPILYHGHCHEKALLGTSATLEVLKHCTGGAAREINSGCCGMAGAFGHEVEHYDLAKAIGEQRLFPAVRARGEAQIAVTGFSCRHHIAHHTDAAPRHVIELVADLLGPGED